MSENCRRIKISTLCNIEMDVYDRLESIRKIKNPRCLRGAASELADQIITEFRGGNHDIDRDDVRGVRNLLLEVDRSNFIINQLNWVIHA